MQTKLGHLVEGIDLSKDVDAATFKELEAAFNANGVMVFRGQKITPAEHIRGYEDAATCSAPASSLS